MTIGIIEDDTLLHQALKTALQNAGYQTVSAYTKTRGSYYNYRQ